MDGYSLADVTVQGVNLQPLVGGYELVFSLYLTTYPAANATRRASIHGARVIIRFSNGKQQALGFARPEGVFDIVARQFPANSTPDLHLYLQPGQLAAIESLRSAGDLEFELLFTGGGLDESGQRHVQEQCRIHLPRSDWIKKLGVAGARNVLLLEVPLPLRPPSDEWHEIDTGLHRAEEQYRGGDYHSCIGSCRTVMEEIGHRRFKNEKWAAEPLERLANNRSGMTKGEREAAVWAVLRHYTHQAHHGSSEGGATTYTRGEAEFVLTLTAAAVARAHSE
ncbi:MAG: hypothetical protein AB7N54_20350 [Alphaproteobacteria bacterium]